VENAGRNVGVRVDAEVALALVYLQTNRYSEARRLFAGLDGVDLPLWELMKSFGDEQPYRIEWGPETEVALPFVQRARGGGADRHRWRAAHPVA
jgi:hypothetical protein